jgi:hypothetical protein
METGKRWRTHLHPLHLSVRTVCLLSFWAIHFIQLLISIVHIFSLYSRETKMADRKRQVRSEAKVLKMYGSKEKKECGLFSNKMRKFPFRT